MCGIAGILDLRGESVDPEAVRAITRPLAHRGPDGEGVFVDGEVGLGHRRLAILDLTEAGHQPMPCADGRYWITFNGEIFNFVELRQELEALGHTFHSNSDTEVIGIAFHEWGTDCVMHFNGMWAFALWDSHRRELFASRDHFGIKPFFYLSEGRRFVFASELKSFLHLRDFTARENEEAVKQALADPVAFELTEDSLLDGVRRLPRGHNIVVRASGVTISRWWRTLDHVPSIPRTFEQQTEQFHDLFFDACRIRLRSDVPVGTCLSGGLDSSSVLCALADLRDMGGAGTGSERRTDDFQRAFVATFPDTWKDERDYAEMVIARTQAQARYCPMDAEVAIESVRQFVYDFENFGGSLLMPQWSIYRELRRDGVVVSLDGHGGDELLAGYSGHVVTALNSTNLLDVRRTRELIGTLQPLYPSGQTTELGVFAGRLRTSPVGRGIGRVLDRFRGAGGTIDSVPPGWLRTAVGPARNSWVDAEESAAVESLGALNGILYSHFHHAVLPGILRNFERCSMAHGVEVRMPFMDWRLVTFSFGLPEDSKLGGGFTKRILREAMRGSLPEPVRQRRDKIGFSPPMAHWFEGAFGDWVWSLIESPSFLGSTVWNGPLIRDFVASKRAIGTWSEDQSEMVWRFVHAHLWHESFFENAAPGAAIA